MFSSYGVNPSVYVYFYFNTCLKRSLIFMKIAEKSADIAYRYQTIILAYDCLISLIIFSGFKIDSNFTWTLTSLIGLTNNSPLSVSNNSFNLLDGQLCC